MDPSIRLRFDFLQRTAAHAEEKPHGEKIDVSDKLKS
jgi:hypothetical protein